MQKEIKKIVPFSYLSLFFGHMGFFYFTVNVLLGFGDDKLHFQEMLAGSIFDGVYFIVTSLVIFFQVAISLMFFAGLKSRDGEEWRDVGRIVFVFAVFTLLSGALFVVNNIVRVPELLFIETLANIALVVVGIVVAVAGTALLESQNLQAANEALQMTEYEATYAAQQEKLEKDRRERKEAYAELVKANEALEKRNEELERLNKLFTGREIKMAQMKEGN